MKQSNTPSSLRERLCASLDNNTMYINAIDTAVTNWGEVSEKQYKYGYEYVRQILLQWCTDEKKSYTELKQTFILCNEYVASCMDLAGDNGENS